MVSQYLTPHEQRVEARKRTQAALFTYGYATQRRAKTTLRGFD